MKQSFIFEKRNITFGKILMSNKVTLYFTSYVFINYITNIYFTYELNKCFDSDYCKNIENKNNSIINYFSTKIYYNHLIIKYELLLLLLLVFYRIKINYYYEHIINCNVLLYFLTPLYNHFYFINNNIFSESILLDNTKIRSIYLYYLESDLLSSILIFIPILFLLGFICINFQKLFTKYIFNNILYYYHKNIENIPIEYTEMKFIEIDKIV
jgi:hypothetical protein